MVLLGEEQTKERVRKAAETVGEELAQHKGSYAPGGTKKRLPDDFSLDFLKPYTIGQQFSVEEIKKKLNKAFLDNNLKNVQFEFGLASFDRNGIENFITRQSENFATFYEDSLHNSPIIDRKSVV